MHRVAFAIEKGGTGKTTCAVHLAHALALMGRTVLLVDTDTQDQCAAHLGIKQFRPGLAELILGETTPRDAIVKARDRLFLLPAGDKLSGVKMRLTAIADRSGIEPHRLLATALRFLNTGKLDYVIIDAAPGNDAFLINVVLYAQTVIVPVPPEMQAVRGMMRFFSTLSLFGRQADYILPTFHDQRVPKTDRIASKLKERFGERMLEKISYTSWISEAAGAGITLFEYHPEHRAAEEFQALARFLDKRG
ncbi:MAG: ParA family protein [Desulfovibrionaceae bacterium]